MIAPAAALTRMMARVRPVATETIPLERAGGRVLVIAPVASQDFPTQDNSAMDGYALRAADAGQALRLLAAGEPLVPGTAARVLTGGGLPAGADAVVPQEQCQQEGDRLRVPPAIQPGQFVRYRGEGCQAGSTLLKVGQRLRAADLSLLAATGIAEVTVYRRPVVGLLASGNEVQPLGEPLLPGHVYDANRYGLTVLLTQAGCEVQHWGIVPDDRPRLQQVLRQALTADAVVSTGGTAVGDSDWVGAVLAELGAEIAVQSVAIKPGKPLIFATFAQYPALYFGVPGNPVSALVSGWRFLQPVLRQLGGKRSRCSPGGA
ncbi:MAG: molybdopterin molybdotransferase MoeA [Pseudanabaenaceae cyanobacterium]